MTSSVSGYTVEKSQEIWDETVVSATLSPDGSLIFHQHNDEQLNLGPLGRDLKIITQSIVTLGSFDAAPEDVIVPEWSSTAGVLNTKLSNPATLPASIADADWSPDGVYLITGAGSPEYFYIYKRSGDTFTKLTAPATAPTGFVRGISWSPNGLYLAVAHDTTPFISIYKRSGDTLTKLANPATLPASTGRDVAWSPDGTYLAVGHDTTPFITIYKRSGDTFTKLANPAYIPPASVRGVSWARNGKHLALGVQDNTQSLVIYRRSVDTFTKLADPTVMPTGQTGNHGVAWSPDGRYLLVGHSTITIYERSGDVLTEHALFPTANPRSVNWSPDGKYFVATTSVSPYFSMYKRRDSDSWESTGGLDTFPTGVAHDASWSPDGVHLIICHNSSPIISIYKTSFDPVTPPISPTKVHP